MEQSSQKLRSTCDRCTLLKVRCNKERPSCERCTKAFEKCVYAPYRWKGRPGPGTDKPGLNTAASSGSRPPYSSGLNSSALDDKLSAGPNMTSDARGFLTSAAPIVGWQAHEFQGVGDFIDMLTMDHQMMGPGTTPHQSEGMVVALSDTELESVNSAEHVSSKPQGARVDGMDQIPALDHLECGRIMLELLDGLHQPNPQCQAKGRRMSGPSPRSSDRSASSNQVMKSNRAARHHLDLILTRHCRATCLARLEARYLLKAVCCRIQTQYEHVFSSMTEEMPPSHPSTPAAQSNGYSETGTVFFDPVQLGDFPLSHQGEMRINAELLYCELQAWESVVARVGSINQDGQLRETVDGSEIAGGLRSNPGHGAGSRFEAVLGDRIQGLMKGIKVFRDNLA